MHKPLTGGLVQLDGIQTKSLNQMKTMRESERNWMCQQNALPVLSVWAHCVIEEHAAPRLRSAFGDGLGDGGGERDATGPSLADAALSAGQRQERRRPHRLPPVVPRAGHQRGQR